MLVSEREEGHKGARLRSYVDSLDVRQWCLRERKSGSPGAICGGTRASVGGGRRWFPGGSFECPGWPHQDVRLRVHRLRLCLSRCHLGFGEVPPKGLSFFFLPLSLSLFLSLLLTFSLPAPSNPSLLDCLTVPGALHSTSCLGSHRLGALVVAPTGQQRNSREQADRATL